MRSRTPSNAAVALYRRELVPWLLVGCTLGLVEGAAAAVLIKRGFEGAVPRQTLNLAVAFVSGSPALANMTSFLWANLAHGRERVGLLVLLLGLFGLTVGALGLLPAVTGGLVLAVGAVLAARIIWSGVLTVRAAVWSANYPRHILARITGRIVIWTSLGMAGSAALAGQVLEAGPDRARILYVVAGLAGLAAAWFARRVRIRQSFRLRQAELAEGGQPEIFSLRIMREILASDPEYRRFMTCMALYGAGNLMIWGQLVIIFSDQLHIPASRQMGILTVVPLLCIPLFTPFWARMFDSGHVIAFRARQCWATVAGMAVMIVAVYSGQHWQLWLASLLFGVATAGAHLGWNLGHNDFASLGKVQQYMGINVTLTGMRGLIAPPVGALVYTLLEQRAPGAGRMALLLPLAITLAGAIGFNRMQHNRTGSAHA